MCLISMMSMMSMVCTFTATCAVVPVLIATPTVPALVLISASIQGRWTRRRRATFTTATMMVMRTFTATYAPRTNGQMGSRAVGRSWTGGSSLRMHVSASMIACGVMAMAADDDIRNGDVAAYDGDTGLVATVTHTTTVTMATVAMFSFAAAKLNGTALATATLLSTTTTTHYAVASVETAFVRERRRPQLSELDLKGRPVVAAAPPLPRLLSALLPSLSSLPPLPLKLRRPLDPCSRPPMREGYRAHTRGLLRLIGGVWALAEDTRRKPFRRQYRVVR
jgi:hypothetical protein